MSVVKAVGLVVLVLVVGVGMTWVAQGNEFFLYKFFAPRTESVRRQVFEQTKSYKQGMTQELQNMQFEWAKQADPNAKAAMASIILHRAADFDPNIMTPCLRSFIEQLKRDRMTVKH